MKQLFTKPDCPACHQILATCSLEGVEVYELAVDNPESLGMLAFYEGVAEAEISLPILVVSGVNFVTNTKEIAHILNGEWVECEGGCSL